MWLGVAGFSAGLVLGPAMAYVGGPPESVRIFECAVYGIALGIVADLFASIIRWDKGGSARARDQGVIRQFTLRALLFGVAILAVYCALLARWPLLFGVLAVPLSILGISYLAKQAGAKVNLGVVAVLLIIGLILVGLLMPAVQSTHHGRRHACPNNLRQIGLALASYHDRHGRYPPAYVADAEGKPLVSWRVLLLPYMNQGVLYNQWKQHRDEPWNGPNNSRLSQTALNSFHCPSETSPITDTSYVAVVGAGTIWPGRAQSRNAQITDGTSNTLIVVEVANSGINWMEPRNLDFDERAPGINPRSGQGISSNHPAYVCVLFADGRSQTLSEDVSEEQLRAMLTIAGGEMVVLP